MRPEGCRSCVDATRQRLTYLLKADKIASTLPGMLASASAADFREQYGRDYRSGAAPRLERHRGAADRAQAVWSPVAASPEPQCRAFTKRRSNEFGELVIRRIRICEEVVRGPASGGPASLRVARSMDVPSRQPRSLPATGR